MEENKKPENPPAFPTTWDTSYNSIMQTENGMTLRDHFAGLALQGMLCHSTRYKPRVINSDENWHNAISEEAYEIADAMLKRREL